MQTTSRPLDNRVRLGKSYPKMSSMMVRMVLVVLSSRSTLPAKTTRRVPLGRAATSARAATLLAGQKAHCCLELLEHPGEGGDGVIDVTLGGVTRQREADRAVGLLLTATHGEQHMCRFW